MMALLNHIFSAACGQNLDHTWAPAGLLLPCCQRCLGLYAGAAVAMGLHWWLKPRLTRRFLEVHGLFLLVMLPFGFHWLPQGPVLRTLSGIVFGFGIVTFLWLPLAARIELRRHDGADQQTSEPIPNEHDTLWRRQVRSWRQAAYACGLLGCMLFVPLLAGGGGHWAALVLSAVAICGLATLASLAAANVCLAILAGFRHSFRVRRARQMV
jgi:uncharacterized membrane protein